MFYRTLPAASWKGRAQWKSTKEAFHLPAVSQAFLPPGSYSLDALPSVFPALPGRRALSPAPMRQGRWGWLESAAASPPWGSQPEKAGRKQPFILNFMFVFIYIYTHTHTQTLRANTDSFLEHVCVCL
jgi:hypothetical protein